MTITLTAEISNVEVGNDEQILRERVLGQNQLKRRMPKTARTVLWEDRD